MKMDIHMSTYMYGACQSDLRTLPRSAGDVPTWFKETAYFTRAGLSWSAGSAVLRAFVIMMETRRGQPREQSALQEVRLVMVLKAYNDVEIQIRVACKDAYTDYSQYLW